MPFRRLMFCLSDVRQCGDIGINGQPGIAMIPRKRKGTWATSTCAYAYK